MAVAEAEQRIAALELEAQERGAEIEQAAAARMSQAEEDAARVTAGAEEEAARLRAEAEVAAGESRARVEEAKSRLAGTRIPADEQRLFALVADGVVLDVRDPAAVGEMTAQALELRGHLDILVNNAAGNFYYPSEALSDSLMA